MLSLKSILLSLMTLLHVIRYVNSFHRRGTMKMCSTGFVKTNVCVVGGGFGGLYTALKLAKQKDMKNSNIYLFDSKDKFVFLPLLYELAVGSASILEVAPKFEELLKGTSVTFVQGNVRQITDSKITVETPNEVAEGASSKEFNFDKLVIAAGAQPRVDTIKGAADFSLPFSRVEDAYKLKSRLRLLTSSDRPLIRVAVIGGGYSGVEVATSVAEYIGRDRAIVSIVDRNSAVMHSSPPHNRKTAEKSLLSYGVSLNLNTSVVEILEDGVIIQEKDGSPFKLNADLIILTCGVQPSALIASLDVPKDASGRILTTRTLQLVNNPSIFALGDCASIEGELLPSTAQVAMQQADIVAKNIQLLSNMTGSSGRHSYLEKFRFVPLGEMLTLGGTVSDASITSLGGLVELDGPLAALARRAVYAARMPTTQQALTAAVSAGVVTLASVLLKVSSSASAADMRKK